MNGNRAKIEQKLNANRTWIELESNVHFTFDLRSILARFTLDSCSIFTLDILGRTHLKKINAEKTLYYSFSVLVESFFARAKGNILFLITKNIGDWLNSDSDQPVRMFWYINSKAGLNLSPISSTYSCFKMHFIYYISIFKNPLKSSTLF